MARQGLRMFNIMKTARYVSFTTTRHSSATSIKTEEKKLKEIKTEDNMIYLHDPDTFGLLSRYNAHNNVPEDENEKKEEEFLTNQPMPFQKLTTRQYADLIKQYLKHKRLKEAIDVLEQRMLAVDRVKPENYIYNILIGACADVGYTKKAFKLFNEMKRRGLKPTGDTYTCLFTACYRCPWPAIGLKNAKHLRELMIEKGIEPNLTNYNSMIKAFGKCGDLDTAFKIVDEMKSKKIKLRVHTFNHLLHACITDKQHGLKYALIVWRKMLQLREKPNIYSFNLMLKCVKDCNIGTQEDIQELVGSLQSNLLLGSDLSSQKVIGSVIEQEISPPTNTEDNMSSSHDNTYISSVPENKDTDRTLPETNTKIITTSNPDNVQILAYGNRTDIIPYASKTEQRAPNLLAIKPEMSGVLSLHAITTLQEKFAVVGGQDDFLKEMAVYNVKPDKKTFAQMMMLVDDNREAELQLMETIKSNNVRADIEIFNILIKKRCLRLDYEGAFDIMKMIEEENKLRKKKHPLKKNIQLKPTIMTYGVLAMACETKEACEEFLKQMEEKHYKINIEIMGTLLRQGTVQKNFGHIMYIMKKVKEANLKVNDVFLKHLEAFNDKCESKLHADESGTKKCSEEFKYLYRSYLKYYKEWLRDLNIEEALEPKNPWEQFKSPYPETVQRGKFKIDEPKRFYKRQKKRGYLKYKVI